MTKRLQGRNLWNILLFVLAIPIIVYAFSSGPIPGVTGGFGEPTCNQAGCHVGIAVDSGPGKVTITAPQFYTSGEMIPITVAVSDPDQRRWGFELSARILNSPPPGQQAGTLIPGTDGFTQRRPDLNGIQYISHTTLGTRNGTPGVGGVSFNFTWQAPPDISAGPVVFNVAGNAANGDFNHTGDRIYTTSATLQPQQVSGAPPSVPSNGAVNGASFAQPPVLAAGTIFSVFGTNLTDGSIGIGFEPDTPLPTRLASARVLVNGVAAPLLFAKPDQINAQFPVELTGLTSATIQVEVQTEAGTMTSPAITVPVERFSPGIFTWDGNGSGPGAILRNSDFSQICPPGRADCPANRAVRGEVVAVFMTGLGPVEEPFPPSGEAAKVPSRTLFTPEVTLGGIKVPPLFSGLAVNFMGLYQVNVRVPSDAPAGDHVELTLTIEGKPSNTVTIAILGEGIAPPSGDGLY